jgi:hypothetical protein
MTKERIKFIGIITAALIAGILIGVMTPKIYLKSTGHHHSNGNYHEKEANQGMEKTTDRFTTHLMQTVEADSAQKEKIKPVAAWASSRFISIQQTAHEQAKHVLDSLKQQLRPLVNETQWSKLENFDPRARGTRHKHHKSS